MWDVRAKRNKTRLHAFLPVYLLVRQCFNHNNAKKICSPHTTRFNLFSYIIRDGGATHYILCTTFPVLQLSKGNFSCVHKNVRQRKRAGTPITMILCKQGVFYRWFRIFPQIWYQSCPDPHWGPFSNQLLMTYSGSLFKLLTWALRMWIPKVRSSCIYLCKRVLSSCDVILFLFCERILFHLLEKPKQLTEGRNSHIC